MIHEIDKVKLIMERLAGRWSFTGQELDWRVTLALDVNPCDAAPYLLSMVKAYGMLAAAAGDAAAIWVMPADWDRMFKHCGQMLMFELPKSLESRDFKLFDCANRKAFMIGYGAIPSPSLP